jgi:YegS/Rv2252/BmrU family lipid kinase
MPNSTERERALILVNPQARLAQGSSWQDRVVPVLGGRYAVELATPSSAAELTHRAAEAARDGLAVVIAAGGDGTVNAVAQGLGGSRTPLGILPLGSANDLARELGIPRHDVAAAAKRIIGAQPQLTDLGVVGGRVFCGVGGMALVARAALAVNRFKRWSPLARWCANVLGGGVYRVSATVALLKSRALHDTMQIVYRDVEGERRTLDVRASALFVTNHRTLGGGLVLPVDANPTDGVLEICIVPSRPRVSLMLNFARLSAGRPIPAGVLQIVRATDMAIETERDGDFVADGELLASGRRFVIGIARAALWIA